jgi:hypothetical protein
VGEQWSIGVLGRLTYCGVKMTADVNGDPKSDLSIIVPGVLFSATHH